MIYAESENLTKATADSEISGSQVKIFCSPEMDCLVLIYDCLNSEILLSLYIRSNDKKVTRIKANRLYSIAFFGVNNSTDRPLERHPGRVLVVNDDVVYPEASSAASTSIDGVFLFCAVCLLLVIQ